MYEKFNSPYKSPKRSCFNCDSEISIGDTPLFKENARSALVNQLWKHFENLGILLDLQLLETSKSQLENSKSLKSLYHSIACKLLKDKDGSKISLLFIKLEKDPKNWQDLIFSHLEYFPDIKCHQCLEWNCFYCGNKSHSETCKSLKLENSKSCPKCKIIISVNLNFLSNAREMMDVTRWNVVTVDMYSVGNV